MRLMVIANEFGKEDAFDLARVLHADQTIGAQFVRLAHKTTAL
jgi:hypothetical protein